MWERQKERRGGKMKSPIKGLKILISKKHRKVPGTQTVKSAILGKCQINNIRSSTRSKGDMELKNAMTEMKNAIRVSTADQMMNTKEVHSKAGPLNCLLRKANSNQHEEGLWDYVTLSNKSVCAYMHVSRTVK